MDDRGDATGRVRASSRLGTSVALALTVTLVVACGAAPVESRASALASTLRTAAASPLVLPGKFAFTATGGDLWVMHGDGSDRRVLADSGAGVDISPTWAPDGSQLAFRHSTGTGASPQDHDTIRVVGADGSGARDLISGSFPAWSPDGAWIAFRGVDGVDLAVIRPDGSGLTSLGARSAECPLWSPDGKKLLYCRNEDESGRVSDDWKVWVMNRDGSEQRQLTNDSARDYPVAWSADGSRVAFFSDRTGGGTSFVMAADGSGVRRATDSADLASVNVWLPDGRFIMSAGSGDPREWFAVSGSGSRQLIPQLTGAFDPIGWIDRP